MVIMNSNGVIYILTNPSFTKYVKMRYAESMFSEATSIFFKIFSGIVCNPLLYILFSLYNYAKKCKVDYKNSAHLKFYTLFR